MKVLLLLLAVLLGLAYYYYFYRDQAASKEKAAQSEGANDPTAKAPSAKQGFSHLITALRQDVESIPQALDGPGHAPANALAIKRRVSPYVANHAEYQVLAQACDLIISADAQRTTFQQSCHAEQTRVSFGTSLQAGGQMDKPTSTLNHAKPVDPKVAQSAIHRRVEASWQSYRTQMSMQVDGLLVSLAGKQL